MSGHLHVVPTREYARRAEPARWCFHCRKRLPGDLVFHTPLDELSYYGPHITYECSGCHEDRRMFPGSLWEPL